MSIGQLTRERTPMAASPAGRVGATSWWRREHPTLTPISGFYAGLVYIAVLPASLVMLLQGLLDERLAQQLSPVAALTLVVPLALVASPRTRRFGGYFALGVLLTLAVVLGTTAAVLWVMLGRT